MSPYLLAILLAWLAAQGAKYVTSIVRTGKLTDWRQLYISGGMPSAHSATMIAITTVIGLRDGFNSGLFGLAVMVSVIVMYDAMMVRRSSGAQGEALKALITELKSVIAAPKVVRGHQPTEVLIGALVGVAVGYIVFLATI
ncbi:divergent PAP2 family protein [Candidatus Mycosynbacter amalyticus]|uniref:Divergent PAP2 family protein n=1 Tax=Candidatus Mycosynbacter amalyticus TaxID=2665156 RepID=A0A857ML07_9BACT|nr:divergent PAP2 family protein [Candidatus Mycosynbacter amalyticus]QHN42465.1 divergent PAP2 family protein [Candidatus Mycosynbacter amalyticus]